MASLIKSQILKHLSKFAKNLSADQINVSTLKGEGELKNLELNEEVLTDLAELPSWLRLSRATCNRVSMRIQWTKLKSVPIQLSLDEVRVEVETCENLRTLNASGLNPKSSMGSGGSYGFVEKVVDGITVTVNSVLVILHSHVFTASFQMSRIVLESKSPTWSKTDLRMTRIKDTDKGEVLNFKELSWHTVRIEAKSTKNEDLTPLRLITNQARCRLTIKKKMSDCTVLGCRLVLILDDLLWVLTDDQLKAALHFGESLSGLLKRATSVTQKVKGARKLESLSAFQEKSKESRRKSQQSSSAACAAARVFARYDVIETSYHFYSDRIDLHLCGGPGGRGRSCHPRLSDGGAFQISLSRMQVDFYPYHLAVGNRSAWIRYQESVHSTWLNNGLDEFQSRLTDALTGAADVREGHSPLTRAAAATGAGGGSKQARPPPPLPPRLKETEQLRETIGAQFKKLLTNNLVVRLSNFSMWKVSTSAGKVAPQEFITGERERFSLPDDMPVIHFEYTQFYYPGDMEFPVPPPKFFAYINPVQIHLDPLTLLWLNAFSLNLQQSVKVLSLEKTDAPYLDVKVEAIMFRVVVEGPMDHISSQLLRAQRDRPRSLHLQVSRVLAANYRSIETGSRADLARQIEQFQKTDMFFGTDFPNDPTKDFQTVCDKFVRHATGEDSVRPGLEPLHAGKSPESQLGSLQKDLLWVESKDVWSMRLDPVWAEFHGTPSAGSRPIPLVDAFPVSLWIYKQPEEDHLQGQGHEGHETGQDPGQAKMHILGNVSSLISAQLNHYQLLFLLRVGEMISEITTFLTHDVRHILGEEDEGSVAVGLLAPQIDASLLMPSIAAAVDVHEDVEEEVAVKEESADLNATAAVVEEPLLKVQDADLLGGVASSHGSGTPSHGSSKDSVGGGGGGGRANNHYGGNMLTVTDTPSSSLASSPTAPSRIAAVPVSSPTRRPDHMSNSSLHGFNDNDAASDLTSIKSEESTDSENFVIVGQAEDPEAAETALFNIHSKRASPVVEVAAEVTEELPAAVFGGQSRNPSPPPTPRLMRRDGKISVTTFHLGGFALAQQSHGRDSAIKIQGASFSSEECPAISWEDFQSKFTLRGKSWSDSTLTPPSSWCYRLRFSSVAPDHEEVKSLSSLGKQQDSPTQLRAAISRLTGAKLELRAQNLPLQFNMSTVAGLGDLVEDEFLPTPLPMEIRVDNIALRLVEDRPPPNITSPGTPPIDLAIPTLLIVRDKSGLFSIRASDSGSSGGETAGSDSPSSSATRARNRLETELQQRASLLAADNANMRSAVESANAEMQALKKRIQELEVANRRLSRSAQETATAEKENRALKQTLKYLQAELVKAGKKVQQQ